MGGHAAHGGLPHPPVAMAQGERVPRGIEPRRIVGQRGDAFPLGPLRPGTPPGRAPHPRVQREPRPGVVPVQDALHGLAPREPHRGGLSRTRVVVHRHV